LPLFSVFLSPGFSTELMHLFLAQDLRKVEAVPEADERMEIAEVSLAEAEAMVYRGEVQNAAAVCGLLAVAARRRT
jgi:ADP-ribose pyrophosphatase